MTEHAWQLLAGVHPENSKFPARTTLDNEGIIVFRTQQGFRGVQRTCPHMQSTLMSAELIASDTMLRCPMHIFTFKLSDGKGVNCPGFRLTVYEIKREEDALYGRRIG
jgi:nitrite reductase/ring-hydroxylating ferredoxin subunit